MTFQKAWVSFEGIFFCEEIKKVLSEESTIFECMNLFWRETIRLIREESSHVKHTTERPGFSETLKKFNLLFEQIQKSMDVSPEGKSRQTLNGRRKKTEQKKEKGSRRGKEDRKKKKRKKIQAGDRTERERKTETKGGVMPSDGEASERGRREGRAR